MTSTTPITPTTVEISRPTVQYTTRGQPALIQFARKSPRDGTWKHEQFHPTQDELAAHEAAATPGAPAAYWDDAGVEAATLAYLAEEYGITNAVFVDDQTPQPDVPVAKTRLEQAGAGDGAAT